MPVNNGGQTRVADCRLLELSKIADPRGNLTVLEPGRPIPFSIERVYWVYDVPGGENRDGHAYKSLQECVVSLSGTLDVLLDDGIRKRIVTLNRPYTGLYIPAMIWRRLENFSTNTVCLILASQHFSEQEYVRDFETFLREKTGTVGSHDNR